MGASASAPAVAPAAAPAANANAPALNRNAAAARNRNAAAAAAAAAPVVGGRRTKTRRNRQHHKKSKKNTRHSGGGGCFGGLCSPNTVATQVAPIPPVSTQRTLVLTTEEALLSKLLSTKTNIQRNIARTKRELATAKELIGSENKNKSERMAKTADRLTALLAENTAKLQALNEEINRVDAIHREKHDLEIQKELAKLRAAAGLGGRRRRRH